MYIHIYICTYSHVYIQFIYLCIRAYVFSDMYKCHSLSHTNILLFCPFLSLSPPLSSLALYFFTWPPPTLPPISLLQDPEEIEKRKRAVQVSECVLGWGKDGLVIMFAYAYMCVYVCTRVSTCVSVCVFVCVCVCFCVCLHTYIHTYTFVSVCVYVYICIYMYMYKHIYTVFSNTFIRIYMHTSNMHTDWHMYIR